MIRVHPLLRLLIQPDGIAWLYPRTSSYLIVNHTAHAEVGPFRGIHLLDVGEHLAFDLAQQVQDVRLGIGPPLLRQQPLHELAERPHLLLAHGLVELPQLLVHR